jgi:hypothetical protein
MTPPRPVSLAQGVAYFERVKAEFPAWSMWHQPGGFHARMGELHIGPMTLRELERILRAARDDSP